VHGPLGLFTEPRLAVYLYAFVPSIIIAPHSNLCTPWQTQTAKKTSRMDWSRKQSLRGPGGLGELEAPALKESTGNRRKSAFIPAVKSILASNDEDEKKRRDARRKSLGALQSADSNTE
jgi:hypothetical protein